MATAMHEEDSRQYPIQEHMRFQYALWIFERIFWVLVAVVPLVALTGIFAHGSLSEQTIGAPDSRLTLQYERFQRKTALSRFVVHAPASDAGDVKLRLEGSFQRAFEIESIQPEPVRSSGNATSLDLTFQRPDSGEFVAVIWTRPRQFGFFEFRAAADDSKPIGFSVLVYP